MAAPCIQAQNCRIDYDSVAVDLAIPMERDPMQKKTLVAIAAASLFSITAIAADGTYNASAQGQVGQVPVTVTIENNKVTKIDIGQNKETVGIGSAAAPKVAQRIVDAQSLVVDGVSGATATSNAVKQAVRTALTQAGLDLKSWEKKTVQKVALQDKTLVTDIVILGGGGAGMISAINASDQGMKVLLLEKMEFLGGASSICAGGMLIEGSQLQKDLGVINDSPEKFVADMLKNGKNLNNKAILDVYARNVGPTVDWLIGKGIKLVTKGGVQSRAEFQVPRLLLLQGGCPGYAQTLREMVAKTDTQILLGTQAKELIVENGSVTGVKAEGNGKLYTVKAKSVILATGGYGANRDMLGGTLKNKLYYGPVSSTGDGHKMAMNAGAGMQLMQYAKIYYNGLEVAPGIAKSTLTGNARALSLGAIMVDKNGKRVVDEKGTGPSIIAAQAKAEGGLLYLVLDEPTFKIFREGIKNNGVSTAEVEKWLAQNGKSAPLFAHADTLADAARIAGINADNLVDTVKRYNGFVKTGKDEDFGRKPANMKAEISSKGPYYIVEQKPRFATTMGSVQLSKTLQVLDKHGKPIPNLYAAGEVANCVHGDDSAPAANVAWVATSAKLASDSAVKNAKK